MKPKPYETVVHMFTIFFYVLMSLALKEILTTKDFSEKDQQWPCFIGAVFLFARFLFGSSSHLYAEHAEEKEKAVTFFTIHLAWIMVFALVGTGMCFAENVHEFLVRNICFGAITVAASILDLVIETRGGIKFKDTWALHWLVFNTIHTGVAFACLKWYSTGNAGEIWHWNLALVGLFVVLGGLLLCDFAHQLNKLGKAFAKRQKAEAADAVPAVEVIEDLKAALARLARIADDLKRS